jgi:hypothetical protein
MIKPRFGIIPLVTVILLELIAFVLVSLTWVDADVFTIANTETDVFEYTIEIDNGIDKIAPLAFFNSSHQIISEREGITEALFADGFGLSGYAFREHLDEIPAIEEGRKMTLIISDTITVISIRVYNANEEEIYFYDSWNDYQALDEGQYFIEVSIHNQVDNEYVNASCLFVLIVGS